MSRAASNLRRSSGFTLVELMIAMTLSLILLAGAMSVMYTSKVTYNENDRIARLQEAGRTVVELILRDARAAGFVGCARPLGIGDFVNGLSNSGTLLWNLGQPLFGYEANGGAWTPGLDPQIVNATPGSDIVVIRTSRQGQPTFVTNAAVIDPSLSLQVNRAPNTTVAPGTPMIISDCRGSSAFVATGFAAGGGNTAQIDHAAGGNPGNATTSLTRAFEIGAMVAPVETVIYYVRDSTSGLGPALWQQVGNGMPQVLIEGVENLQITYGIDNDGDLLANQYVTADAVPDWNSVISLSMSILVRSEAETGLDVDSRTYNLLGTNFGPFNDRRQRSVFTTTVTLRNRAT